MLDIPRVCLCFSEVLEHQDLGTSHPAESLILGVKNTINEGDNRLTCAMPF